MVSSRIVLVGRAAVDPMPPDGIDMVACLHLLDLHDLYIENVPYDHINPTVVLGLVYLCQFTKLV